MFCGGHIFGKAYTKRAFGLSVHVCMPKMAPLGV